MASLGAAIVAVVSVVTMTASSLPAGAIPKPGPAPTNPSDQTLQAAANSKDKVAALVGLYNGKVAAAQIALQKSQGVLELAEQKVALTHSQSLLAQAAAKAAKARVISAGRLVDQAHTAFVTDVQNHYYGTGISGTTGGLLTAKNPTDLLQLTALQQYRTESKSDAVGALQTAQVGKSNADSTARLAQAKAVKAEAAATAAQTAAATQYKAHQAEQAGLQATLSQYQTAAAEAQSRLSNLQGQRASYETWHAQFVAYRAEQQRIAAAKAARAAAKARAEAAAARARAEAAANSGSSSGGGGGGGGHSSSGGGSSVSSPPPPSSGGWTAAKGRKAVARAYSTLGIIYAWAGGNQYGPTRGVCAGDGAYNDCNVIGFDCSGLAMYAWGQGWTHYAATQYYQAGSYHPSLDNLKPGDLLFYSYGGASQIHHVAIYIGNGQIIQAPQSGSVIQVSSMYGPGTPYGATRPLT